jgi:hypothetical protein
MEVPKYCEGSSTSGSSAAPPPDRNPTFCSTTVVVVPLKQPEKRLMLAVLEDAVGTFQKYVNTRERNGQRLFSEVEEWFNSDDLQWPYSFVNVSQALGLDVSYMRRGLGRWRDRQRAVCDAAGNVVRFPFRRVNGSRHMITGRASGLRRSA